MTRYYVKAWQLIGHTFDGNAYCLAHSPNPNTTNEHGDQPRPIFASDECYLIDPDTNEHTPHPCRTCGQPITPNQLAQVRYCDQGCGYKLPEEYANDETTCGACLNEAETADN